MSSGVIQVKIRQVIALDVLQHVRIGRKQVLLLGRIVDYVAVESEWVVPANIVAGLISRIADLWHGLEVASPGNTPAGEMPHQIGDGDALATTVASADPPSPSPPNGANPEVSPP
jgi:hypothetical protein